MNLNDRPRFSVVTVCRNAADNLRVTLENLARQVPDLFEIVVVDGASTDTTPEVVGIFRNQITKFVSEPDRGIYDAMNKAVRLCTGEYVVFMNAGDIFASNTVLAQVELILAESSTLPDIIYGDVIVLHPESGKQKLAAAKALSRLSHGMPFCHQATFTRRDQLLLRPFNTNLVSADHHFFWHAFTESAVFAYVPIACAIVTLGGYSDQRRRRVISEYLQTIKGSKEDTLPLRIHYYKRLLVEPLAHWSARHLPLFLRSWIYAWKGYF